VNIVGEVVDEVDSFKYLGSVLQNNGGFDEDIMHRIKCGWISGEMYQVFYAIEESQSS